MVRKYVKTFFFTSKNGTLYFAHVYRGSQFFQISVCDREKMQIGEISLSFQDSQLRYIYNVFVNTDKRNDHIGSHMMEILDYLIREWKYKNIYGVFEPTELYLSSYDKKKLEESVLLFYRKNNFDVINYLDFLENRENYPFLELKNFGTWRNKMLLYRNYVPNDYVFKKQGDIVVHDNTIDRLDEVDNILVKKLSNLKLSVR